MPQTWETLYYESSQSLEPTEIVIPDSILLLCQYFRNQKWLEEFWLLCDF